MNAKKNSTLFGLILGIVVPVIVFFVIYLFKMDNIGSLTNYFSYIAYSSASVSIITMCVLPNLLFFFVFWKSNSLASARGMLAGILIYVFLILFLHYT